METTLDLATQNDSAVEAQHQQAVNADTELLELSAGQLALVGGGSGFLGFF